MIDFVYSDLNRFRIQQTHRIPSFEVDKKFARLPGFRGEDEGSRGIRAGGGFKGGIVYCGACCESYVSAVRTGRGGEECKGVPLINGIRQRINGKLRGICAANG